MLHHLPSALLPYSGDDVERVKRRGAPHSQRTFAHDTTGERTYDFNSLGYRGREFDPTAAKVVFSFGESHAFGLGLELEQVWTSLFTDLWARHQGLNPDDVCLMNFAEHGASNDYIARMALSQCSRVKPDLILVNFAVTDRVEGHDDERAFKIGPWILDKSASQQIRDVENSELKTRLADRVRRAQGYYEYHSDGLGILNTLRNILLVQYFAEAHGIPAIATCNRYSTIRAMANRDTTTVGPLFEQVNPRFLARVMLGAIKERLEMSDDGLHFGPKKHEGMAKAMFAHWLDEPLPPLIGDGARSRGVSANRARDVAHNVQSFYETLPFNFHESTAKAAKSIKSNPIDGMYPDLDRLLRSGEVERVIEFGCGAGWLANTLAHRYPVEVTAVDFSSQALARAYKVTKKLKLTRKVEYVQTNLFDLAVDQPYDLVISMGVLHHTHDTRAALNHVLQFARPRGYAYIGLYHEYGRRIFLRLFRELIKQHGEKAALEHYAALDAARAKDATHLESWFRDQVLHPHETQHTLEEVMMWTRDSEFGLLSTSVNRFAPIDAVEPLFEVERRAEEESIQANQVEKRYLPGFFTVLLQDGESMKLSESYDEHDQRPVGSPALRPQ